MNRYELLDRLGDGTFGEVTKARNLKTNEVVAIKKLKAVFPTWEQCLQLRELKSLRALRHDNIVQLKEVIRDKEELYYVFEYMESSLFKVMRDLNHESSTTSQADDSKPNAGGSAASGSPKVWLSEAQIRSAMYQLFCGLAHMHKHGFFHRDIKPENLLCQDDVLKIADFGQAREIRSLPPFTDYVSTRWYRSPELLLRSTTYNSPIDLWACGCIMVELYLQSPLFPGTSEADQLCRIAKVLGAPTKDTWIESIAKTNHMSFKFPKSVAVPWKNILPASCSKTAVQLVQDLLQYDPGKRLTATQALQHRFFDQPVPRPVLTARHCSTPRDGSSLRSEPKTNASVHLTLKEISTSETSTRRTNRRDSDVGEMGGGSESKFLSSAVNTTSAKDWKDTRSTSRRNWQDCRAEEKSSPMDRVQSNFTNNVKVTTSAMSTSRSSGKSGAIGPEELDSADNDKQFTRARHHHPCRENSLQDLLDEFLD